MKQFLTILIALTLFIFISSSCKKVHDTTGVPKEELIPGKWNINRIQLRVYYNGVFAYDSIIKQIYLPENFVSFGSGNSFEYKFNVAGSNVGTYSWGANESLVCVTPNATYNWKKLTLTDVLFTVMNTETSPLLPGATIERYQTFVK